MTHSILTEKSTHQTDHTLAFNVQCVSKKMLLSEMRQFGHLKPICDIHYYLLNLHMIPGHV